MALRCGGAVRGARHISAQRSERTRCCTHCTDHGPPTPAAAKASSFKAAAGLGLAIQNPTHDVATATEEPPPVDALPTPTVRAAA